MLKILKLRAKVKELQKNLAELREKQNKLNSRAAELNSALEEAETEEDIVLVRSQIEELEKEAGEADFEKQIADLENEIRESEQEIQNVQELPAPDGNNPKPQNEERKVKFKMNTRNSIIGKMSIEQRAAFLADEGVKAFLGQLRSFKGKTRSVSGASYTIPDIMLDILRREAEANSQLLQFVRLRSVAGTARQNIVGIAPEAVWTEAIGILNSLTYVYNQEEVDAYKVGGYIAIENSLLEDSDENLADEIMRMLAEAIAYALDKAIVYGTGTKMPLGFVTRLAQTSEPSDYNPKARPWTDLHTTNIIKLSLASKTGAEFFAALLSAFANAKHGRYNKGATKVWIMNEKTHMDIVVKALAINAAGAIVSSINDEMPIIGGKIIEVDFMADNEIAGGYLANYLVAERKGATFGSSEDAMYIEDCTVFKGTARYDGTPLIAESFVLVNYANVAPTTSISFAPDVANVVTSRDTE